MQWLRGGGVCVRLFIGGSDCVGGAACVGCVPRALCIRVGLFATGMAAV